MAKLKKEDMEIPLENPVVEDSKAYRRFVAASSADQTDNRAVWNNEMNDAFVALKQTESTGVQDRQEKLPRFLEVAQKIGGYLMGIGVVLFLLYLLLCGSGAINGLEAPTFLLTIPVLLAAAGFVMEFSVRIYASVNNRNAWIRRMQEQDAEKARKAMTEKQTDGE